MSAKELVLRPIDGRTARSFIKANHYSGKAVNNSNLHIGAFWHGSLAGVMQFGPPLDKRKLLGLVHGTGWANMMELNRMAFGPELPRNSESRALGVAFRILRKNAPQVKWVVSFADATQCGDGAIYRASGFTLTGIKRSENLARLPDGNVIHKMTLESSPTSPRRELGGMSYYDVTKGRYDFGAYIKESGAEVLPGFQLRYIRFLDPSWRERLTVKEIPFSRIEELGARMYRGQKL